MLIYFLGGESEFTRNIRKNLLRDGGNCRSFKKLGSFARAVKSERPQMVFAENRFLGKSFDLRGFLKEQKAEIPTVFFDCENAADLAYKIKARCKIPKKLFEIFEYLYNCPEAVSYEKMRADFLKAGRRISQNSLSVSLSRLKKLLAAQRDFQISLLRENSGWKLVVLQAPSASACPSLN